MTNDSRPIDVCYRRGELSVRVGPVDGSIAAAVGSEPLLYTGMGENPGPYADWDEIAASTGIALVSA